MDFKLLTLAASLALVTSAFASEDAGEQRRHEHDITTKDVAGSAENEKEVLPHDEFATSETPDKVTQEKKHHKKRHHKKKKASAAQSTEAKDVAPAEHKEEAKKEEHNADAKDAAPAEHKEEAKKEEHKG